MTLNLDNSAIERLLEDSRREALLEYAARLVVLAQMLAPVGRTGYLRRSIERTDVERDGEISVIARAAYSLFVERGTGIYAVEGNGRKTPWVYRTPDGRFYTTEGSRPQPFLLPALDMLARAA